MMGLALAGLGPAGCLDAPEVSVVTEHFEIAADFDHRVCAGTLDALERQLEFVEDALWPTLSDDERIQFYWITRNLDQWCGEGRTGCYWPGTRVVVGDPASAMHEIVHVVLDAPATSNLFVEEGLAELYSGVGAYHRPAASGRALPSELIDLDRSEYREGELDYLVARHFLSYVHASRGKSRVRSVARAVQRGETPEKMRAIFETMFEKSFPEIEQHYLDASRRFYSGIRERTVARVPEDTAHTRVRLDCDAVDTRGPMFDGGPGMYQTMRYSSAGVTIVDLTLHGPARVQLRVFSAPSSHARLEALDFEFPRGATALHTVFGGDPPERIVLDPGNYVFAIVTDEYETVEATLETDVIAVVPVD